MWSNDTLKKYADYFSGEIVNVSGWEDKDKTGGVYQEYFINADKYFITNFGNHAEASGQKEQIVLDLEKPIEQDLKERFDIVYNHTTLEHTFDVRTTFSNLCQMARDAVIIVVPFAQIHHSTEAFKDYWRFTPCAIERLFNISNYTLVVCEHNNNFNAATYLFCIGIRDDMLYKYKDFSKCDTTALPVVGRWIGSKLMSIVKGSK